MTYQSDVQQMQKAGFSGQDVQDWSDNQAVQMRQAGFASNEVDSYQGMQPPAAGTPQTYGRLPTDDDFKNAATTILSGNDHPNYNNAVETLKNVHADTGINPDEAVKISQGLPTFRDIMENGGSPQGSYLQEAARGAGSAIASQMKGLAELVNPDPETNSLMSRPLLGADPQIKKSQDYWMYQKGVALQNWIDEKFPAQPEFEQAHPINTGIASGLAQMPELVATMGTGMAAGGADAAYQEAEKSGASPEKATQVAGQSGALWGVLGVADVGAFLKPIQRAAPGFTSWITAKAAQAVRGGLTFSSTNELGDYLTSQIGNAADIPMQYKPTLERVVTNALTGAIAGAAGRTGAPEHGPEVTQVPASTSEPGNPSGEGPTQPPGSTPPAPLGQLKPEYHFDTDTYGLKDKNGNFVQTGFPTEAAAQHVADAHQSVEADTARTQVSASRLPDEVIDRYKKTVLDEAQRLGFNNITPEQVNNAARTIAEAHNPPEAQKKAAQEPEQEAQQTPAENDLATPAARPRAPQKTPMNALQFIAARGGIWDEGLNGDLRAMDAHKRYGQIMRKDGKSVDNIGAALWDAGYFGDPNTTSRPSTHDVLELIRNSLNGNHSYTESDRSRVEQRQQDLQDRGYRTRMEDDADHLGVTHEGLNDDQLSDALRHANAVEQAKIEYEHELSDSDVERMEREGIQGYYGPDWRPENVPERQPNTASSRSSAEGTRSITGPTSETRTAPEGGRGGQGGNGRNAISATIGRLFNRDAKLPRDLAAAKPRYSYGDKQFTLGFDSDVDKSLFITSQKKPSKRDDDYRNFLEKSGYDADDISAYGKQMRSVIKEKAKNHPEFDDKEKVSNIRIEGKPEDSRILYQKDEGISSESVEKLQPALDFLKRVAPRTRVETQPDAIRTTGGELAHASYDRFKDLITISLSSPDQLRSAAHESLHAIRDTITPREWETIVGEANERGLMQKYNITKRYADEHEEEMVAHWFSDWAKDNATEATPKVKNIFQKIMDVLKGVGDHIRQAFGNVSAEDIFRKIESGEVGDRPAGEKGDRTVFQKSDEDKPTIGDAIRAVRDTISPTSAGDLAKKEEVSLRNAYGQAKRQQAIAESALNEFARQATKMTPAEHSDFYSYVEGRSKGAELKNKQFQAMADTVRDVYSRYRDILQGMPETRLMRFVQDYFTHQWAKGQDEKIKDFMNSWWQQGSGKNLKERKIPTIADGLEAGLKLEEPNPVRAVSRYVGSMSNYIASVKVLRDINKDFGGGYYADGYQPEGYKPLVGRNAERIENAHVDPTSGKLVPARKLQLYAPEQVSDLYNAFYSKGFEDAKLAAPYTIMRNAVNANTMMELGLSAYHFSTINVQSINQDVGRILRNTLAGDWQGVGDAIKGLITPSAHFMQGIKGMDQYKDLADHGVDMEKIAHLFAQSNSRIGLDPLSNVTTHGGFYKAWQRGELPALREKLTQQLTQGYGLGALKTGAEVAGRVISDVSHPLFNVYVPSIKMSSFHDLMGDWLRQNPGATDAETNAQAIRIGDMVEDRFGEMNMENIFWNKKAKELMGLGLRAPGWDIGLVRQTGGAAYDVYRMIKDGVTGKGLDPARLDRPLFMVGAVTTAVAINALMTYLKTGKQPSDQDYKDWMAYATGGTHKAFGIHPERAEIPGHTRELIQLAPNPGQGPLSGAINEAKNKVATLPKNVADVLMNEDWKGKPIYDPKSQKWYERIPGVAQLHYLADGFKPFAMDSLFNPEPGSKISFAERFLGTRAAGAKIVNPEGLKRFNEQKSH